MRSECIYGLTELGGRFCILDPGLVNEYAGSVGKPIAGSHDRIVDPETGQEQPAGQSGEILAGGQYLFKGYFNDDIETKKVLNEEGFQTGDIGYQDPSWLLYIQGRSDDVFKVNGQKVSGIVLSDRLMESGSFEDVAVCREDLELLGPVPVVYYVFKPQCCFQQNEIIGYLHGKVPNNHMPKKSSYNVDLFHELGRARSSGKNCRDRHFSAVSERRGSTVEGVESGRPSQSY